MTTFAPTPERCDICSMPFDPAPGNKMYDAATNMRGMWGCMCETCYPTNRLHQTLGTGKGQEYERRADGLFHKVAG